MKCLVRSCIHPLDVVSVDYMRLFSVAHAELSIEPGAASDDWTKKEEDKVKPHTWAAY